MLSIYGDLIIKYSSVIHKILYVGNYFCPQNVSSINFKSLYRDRIVQTGACKRDHVDGSVPMEACRWEHCYRSNFFWQSILTIKDFWWSSIIHWYEMIGKESNYLLYGLLTDCIFLWGRKHVYGSITHGSMKTGAFYFQIFLMTFNFFNLHGMRNTVIICFIIC